MTQTLDQLSISYHILSHPKHKPQNNIHSLSSSTISNYKSKYIAYFADIQTQINQYIHNQHFLSNYSHIKHNIFTFKTPTIKLQTYTKPIILKTNNLFNSLVIQYQVVVGQNKLCLSLLNLQKRLSNKKLKQLGSGAYGKVYRINISKKKSIACKRMHFYQESLKIEHSKKYSHFSNINKIQDVIYEYSIYKICSLYQIGPKTINFLGFDIICYSNHIQFFVQKCQSVNYFHPNIQKDIKQNVYILHRLQIIHKDLKPANILYSHTYKKFVLSDFGISHIVNEELGKLSKSYKQGTFSYMSDEMVNLQANECAYIDLYHNDLVGLDRLISEYKERFQKGEINIQINQNEDINEQYVHILLFYKVIHNRCKSQVLKILQTLQYNINIDYYPFICEGNIYLHEILTQLVANPNLNTIHKYKIINFTNSLHKKCNPYPFKIQNYIRVYGFTQTLLNQIQNKISSQQLSLLQTHIHKQVNSVPQKIIYAKSSPRIYTYNSEKQLIYQQQKLLKFPKNTDPSKILHILFDLLRYHLTYLKLTSIKNITRYLQKIKVYHNYMYSQNMQEYDQRLFLCRILELAINNDHLNLRYLSNFLQVNSTSFFRLYIYNYLQCFYRSIKQDYNSVCYLNKLILKQQKINNNHRAVVVCILNQLNLHYSVQKYQQYNQKNAKYRYIEYTCISQLKKQFFQYLQKIRNTNTNIWSFEFMYYFNNREYGKAIQISCNDFYEQCEYRVGNKTGQLAQYLVGICYFYVGNYEQAKRRLKNNLMHLSNQKNEYINFKKEINTINYYLSVIGLYERNGKRLIEYVQELEKSLQMPVINKSNVQEYFYLRNNISQKLTLQQSYTKSQQFLKNNNFSLFIQHYKFFLQKLSLQNLWLIKFSRLLINLKSDTLNIPHQSQTITQLQKYYQQSLQTFSHYFKLSQIHNLHYYQSYPQFQHKLQLLIFSTHQTYFTLIYRNHQIQLQILQILADYFQSTQNLIQNIRQLKKYFVTLIQVGGFQKAIICGYKLGLRFGLLQRYEFVQYYFKKIMCIMRQKQLNMKDISLKKVYYKMIRYEKDRKKRMRYCYRYLKTGGEKKYNKIVIDDILNNYRIEVKDENKIDSKGVGLRQMKNSKIIKKLNKQCGLEQIMKKIKYGK